MHSVSFSEIVGQDKAIRFLKGVMRRERIPHAYLFVGLQGVGRTSTALALAQGLNCLEPAHEESCGRCRICRLFQAGSFGDLVVLEPEEQAIKIEQIRGLERTLSYKPQYGRYRVSIIREADRMTEEASNAFLKTLEEPPMGNILILNVTDPSHLLATIVSRCQRVVFQNIPSSLIGSWLMEKKGIDQGRALLLAKLCEGSLGKAIRMEEEDYLEKRSDHLSRFMALSRLSDQETLQLAMELTARARRTPEGSSEGGGREVPVLLSLWKTWIRDILVLQQGGAEEWLINSDYAGQLKKAAETGRMDFLMEAHHLLNGAEKDLLRARNLDLMMENLLLSLRKLTLPSAGTVETGGETAHG